MEERMETGRGIVGIIDIHGVHYPVFNLKDSTGKPNIKADCVDDFEPVYICNNCMFPDAILPFISSRTSGKMTHYGIYGDNTNGVRLNTKFNDYRQRKIYDLSKVFRVVHNNRIYIFDKRRGNYKLKLEFLCSLCYDLDEYFDFIEAIRKKRIR